MKPPEDHFEQDGAELNGGGFTRHFRRRRKHPALSDVIQVAAWDWLIEHASWRPTTVRYKGRSINLARGQLAVSIRDFAKLWGWSKSAGHRWYEKLKKWDMIETVGGTGVMVITICNYDQYQTPKKENGTVAGHHAGPGRDSSGTQNKEEKEDKEGKKELSGRPQTRTRGSELEDNWQPNDASYRIGEQEGYSREEVGWLAQGFVNHSREKRRLHKDPQRAFQNWLRSHIARRDVDARRSSKRPNGSSSHQNVDNRFEAIRKLASRLPREPGRNEQQSEIGEFPDIVGD